MSNTDKNKTRVRNASTKEFSRVLDYLASQVISLENRVAVLEGTKVLDNLDSEKTPVKEPIKDSPKRGKNATKSE